MSRQPLPQLMAERRCPNCGTRVARDAESCFMCGNDLRIRPTRRQRISWIDTLLVLAVVGLLGFWWRLFATDSGEPQIASQEVEISAADIPEFIPTAMPEATIIPIPRPTSTSLPPVTVIQTHLVTAGETLVSIATQYGITVQDLQQRNNLNSVIIRPGDALKVPVLRVPTPVPNSEEDASILSYTVREGDTVVLIASQFGSTVDRILSTNGLDSNALIRPGDLLRVPVSNIPGEVIDGASSAEVATDGPGKIYPQPLLLGPTNSVTLSRDEPILLRWVSVDILAEEEWYVVRIMPESGVAQGIPLIWTKSNSERLSQDFAPAAGDTAQYSWRVSVVRVRLRADGQRGLEAVSPTSEIRIFTWQ